MLGPALERVLRPRDHLPNVLEFHTDRVFLLNGIKPLKEDKREIFRAAADAQKIADMELGFHPAYAAQIEVEPTLPAPAPGRTCGPNAAPS